MTVFWTNDTGAVTVDWVLLTAGGVGLCLATMGVVSFGVENASDDVETELKSDFIVTTAFYDARLASIEEGFSGEVWPRCDASPTCFAYTSYEAEVHGVDGETYTLQITDPIHKDGPGERSVEIRDKAWKEVDLAAVDFGSIDCNDYKDSSTGKANKVCISDYK